MPANSVSIEPSRLNSTKTVVVGCKLPNGLLIEIIPESIKDVWNPLPAGQRVLLKGANSVRNSNSARGLAQLQYPFGITAVPADFWEAWFGRNKNTNLCRNGFIFALDNKKEVVIEAKQRESERTGLEPLNPNIEADPRMRTSPNAPVEQRVTADAEKLAELNRLNSGDGDHYE